jgi:hypothetical protein
MLQERTIWSILRNNVPKGEWVPIGKIYGIVEEHATMSQEDLARRRAHSDVPVWKASVRRVLESKTREGSIRGRRKAI